MTKPDEEALPGRALEVPQDVKHVVRIQRELGGQLLGAASQHELLVDPCAFLFAEMRELLVECGIAIHA